MNANAYDSAFARLKKSKFRSRFHLSDSDRKYIADKGMETIRRQRSGVAKRHPGVEMRNPRW